MIGRTQRSRGSKVDTMQSQTHIGYRLHVRGIFGRNRTEKFAGFDVSPDVPVESPLTYDQIVTLAKEKIASLKVRDGARCKVSVQPVELRDGMRIVSMRIGAGDVEIAI